MLSTEHTYNNTNAIRMRAKDRAKKKIDDDTQHTEAESIHVNEYTYLYRYMMFSYTKFLHINNQHRVSLNPNTQIQILLY